MTLTIVFWISVVLSFLAVFILVKRKYDLSVNEREYHKRQRFDIRDEWYTEPKKSSYQTPVILACLTSWLGWLIIYINQ